MTRTPMLIMLAAAAALAGCNKENHTIVAGPDGADTNATTKAPVALPPSITSSKTYRCADNTLIDVDWMSDGTAHVKKKGDQAPAIIAAGSSDLKGNAKVKSVNYKGQNCNS